MVTSRVSAWRGRADAELFREIFGLAAPEPHPNGKARDKTVDLPVLIVVQLAPWTRNVLLSLPQVYCGRTQQRFSRRSTVRAHGHSRADHKMSWTLLGLGPAIGGSAHSKSLSSRILIANLEKCRPGR